MKDEKPFKINSTTVERGSSVIIDLPVGRLYTHAPMTMPVQIIRGKKDGPRLFISAAIHGDEINGVEIIRRVLKSPALKRLSGTVVAVPIVNLHGFINQSRYLPDRRDLNRSFPGTDKGSLAGRLAHLLMEEIVKQCTHGIDLHTGAIHRSNLPQVRANMDDPETERLAHAFNVPVIISATLRDGSLRQSAADLGMPMLLYEAGEALRFDEVGIRAGVKGIINVMRELKMLPAARQKSNKGADSVVARSSSWVRAPESGILRAMAPLGAHVKKNQLLGIVADPFGEQELQLLSPYSGIVIGRTNLPLVNEGDALFHLARFEDVGEVASNVEGFNEEHLLAIADTPATEQPIT
ncbi:MAG: succinylglutamate desuccinylase/aspartoacylase family protein [Porticoccaceae bacterium]